MKQFQGVFGRILANSIDQLVGNTPLLRLNSLCSWRNDIQVFGKLECVNPSFSVKDRSALGLLESARNEGLLKPHCTIVESTSGNMGHALAMLCAVYKYRFICVLDPKTPQTNISLVKAYGGEVEMVTEPDEHGSFQKKRIQRAKEIARDTPNCFNLDQYNNPSAVHAHYRNTGPEIYRQLNEKVDVLIATVSTGSHLSGTAMYLKEMNPSVLVIGVEPEGSVVFGGKYRPFKQNGTGLSFQPGNIMTEFVDKVVKVSDGDAFSHCHAMAKNEGVLLGGSSGSVLYAVYQTVLSLIEQKSRNLNIVAILPDGGLKYIDTVYNPSWLDSHGIRLQEIGPISAKNFSEEQQ